MTREISRYQLPLPVLRGYLGPSTVTEFESPHEDGTFHRAWRCGCVARYRHSTHQTAVWRPCEAHRTLRGDGAGATAATERFETIQEPIDAAGRRVRPTFFIIDAGMKVLSKSAGTDASPIVARVRRQLERAVRGHDTMVIPYGDALLRVVPLEGQSGTFAVIVELVRADAKRHRRGRG